MANSKTKNAAKQETEKLEPVNIKVRGTLTSAMFGKRSFAKGRDKEDRYRYSIKIVPEDLKALREAAEPYYENVDVKWIPKWLTSDKPEDLEYINLSSHYDIRAGLKEYGSNEMQDLGNLIDDYIADNGNINGSKVILSLTIKEGAIYPAAILIKELEKQTIEDMFEDVDDELPF